MADDQWLLKEDGYLNVDAPSKNIIYHPNLNVILVFTKSNEVKVLDVNSGVILQSCYLSGQDNNVNGKYLPDQDRLLIWDGENIGFRTDYNGVLLLDTILQTPISQTDDNIKLELPLSEAIQFLRSINSLEEHGLENTSDVTNELTSKIGDAQKIAKKGIKSQKWNIICLDLPHSSLKMVANGIVYHLKRLNRHISAMPIASAINERLTELQIGARIIDTNPINNGQRFYMFSEAIRRQTFEKWPHMDYKYALPDQMAQAGFFHQPSATGDDRAMCFTCNVCLVSWEKSDEPWSEHERHSPGCSFVKGEYTQNVPLSVTYATTPGLKTEGFDLISSGSYGSIICTGKRCGEITVWNIDRALKLLFNFKIELNNENLLKKINLFNQNYTINLTALCTYQGPNLSGTHSLSGNSRKLSALAKPHVKTIGTRIVSGIRVDKKSESSNLVNEMNNQNQAFSLQHGIVEKNHSKELFLIVYEVVDNEKCSSMMLIDGEMDKMSEASSVVDDSFAALNKKSSLFKNIASAQRASENFTKLIQNNSSKTFDPWKLPNESDFNYLDANDDDILYKVIEGDMLLQSDYQQINNDKLAKLFESAKETTEEEVGGGAGIVDTEKINTENSASESSIKIDCLDSTTGTSASNNNNLSKTISLASTVDTINSPLNYCEIQTIHVATSDNCKIANVIQSYDKKYLLVVLDPVDEIMPRNVHLILYEIFDNGYICEIALSSRILDEADTPMQICMLPTTDSNGRRWGGNDIQNGAFVMACADGSLQMIGLTSLLTVSKVEIPNEKFVSATYCKSLERLCGCTESGSLHFYSFYDMDVDSGDDRDDENLCFMQDDTAIDITEMDGGGTTADHNQMNQPSTSSSSSANSSPSTFIALRNDLNWSDLKMLYYLTLFDEMLTPYSAEVPGCWSELVQAQKKRCHPHNVRPGDDTHLTKTWRLHNDATTWDEHIIELTLPKATNIGHIDFKFSLYQQCPNPPTIQVTLLKQNSNGLGYRMKPPNLNSSSKSGSSVDESVDFNLGQNDSRGVTENPVLSEEYLLAHNAEILAGPFELSSCMDLCDQGGLVVLTSPKLFKAKGRNFLLHIKTMADPKDGLPKTRVIPKKVISRILFPSYTNNSSSKSSADDSITFFNESSSSQTSSKYKENDNFVIGCDWLHEISITLRSTKNLSKVLLNERAQRSVMLESNNLLNNLIKIAGQTSNIAMRSISLDILLWIITVRLARFRSPRSESRKNLSSSFNQSGNTGAKSKSNESGFDPNQQQVECIKVIEKNLAQLILSCIVFGNRTTAHKCVKIVMTAAEGVQHLPADKKLLVNFDKSLESAILETLPRIVNSKYAGAIRWFMLLISSVSTTDSYIPIAESCIGLLMKVVSEMETRWDQHSLTSLLKTRFGLYGTPFEPELFDAELPLPAKLNTLPTIASVFSKSTTSQTSQTAQSQSIDIKNLCGVDGVNELRVLPFHLRQRGIGNHLKGLLEVEPLHFVCYSASEATRIENMDTLSTSNSGNVIEDIIFEAPFDIEAMGSGGGSNTVITGNGVVNTSVGTTNATTTTNNIASEDGGEVKKSDDKINMHDIESMKNVIMLNNNVKACMVFDKILFKLDNKIQKKEGTLNSAAPGPKTSQIKENDLLTYFDLNADNSLGAYTQIQSLLESDSSDENQSTTRSSTKNLNMFSAGDNSSSEDDNYVFPWHKLLSLPQKQMIVIDRMHSGARRYVTLDFGQNVVLTDFVIPACEDLVSLFVDVWNYEEEEDIIRLVAAPDIGTKTLILSDLQPPPICRYLKITITGRYGMSATRCKIPIGSFFGHPFILENENYADPISDFTKQKPSNIPAQLKVLHSLFEDVNCRYSLSSSKLSEILEPVLKSEMSNIAHMKSFLNRNKDSTDQENSFDYTKLMSTYDECTTFQLQLNIIRNVINRLTKALNGEEDVIHEPVLENLSTLGLDKLRVTSECLIDVLLYFIMEYGIKNDASLHNFFDPTTCNTLFNTLVVSGDAHMQLATCSLLVRMCCFQPWWGDFLTNVFTKYFSSQNSRIFPQDRVFFLMTYLGRKSISMGKCRAIVIDAVLKTLATLLAPLSPQYRANELTASVSSETDLQLISWLLLFLSVCIDDGIGKKSQGFSRWDFISGEADMSKARTQLNNNNGRNFSRSFKKRLFQTKQYNNSTLAEKLYLMQAEDMNSNQLQKLAQNVKVQPIYSIKSSGSGLGFVGSNAGGSSTSFINSGSSNNGNSTATTSSSTSSNKNQPPAEPPCDPENPFDKGLRALKGSNSIVVIRGLVGLLLGMDFTCNMDLFLLTCKIIARLVSACRPTIQLSRIMTTEQLQQLIRIAVWKDQQQPWAVHAITCLLQDILEADKNYKQSNINYSSTSSSEPLIPTSEANDFDSIRNSDVFNEQLISENLPPSLSSTSTKDCTYADVVKFNQLPSLMECEDTEMEDILDDILERGKNLIKKTNNITNRNGLTVSYRSVSSARDSRLEYGLESNIQVNLRRLTTLSSLYMFASLPQMPLYQSMTIDDLPPWPDNVVEAWSSPEYNQGMSTNVMLMMVFDNIFAYLHLQGSWLNLEQVLQLWLTLNGELSDKTSSLTGFNPGEIPKIPFGPHAVHGLLSALSTHCGIKLRAWCLGFQCLTMACNPNFSFDSYTSDLLEDYNENNSRRMGVFIVNNSNFEAMLLRFYSGSDIHSSNFDVNRCAGPTLCKLLHELFIWLEIKSDVTDMVYVKKKVKEILLRVLFQLVQPGGAISNRHGPIDAQCQLIKELTLFHYEKTDLGVAMSIIESVSFLIYNNISNLDKIYCQTTAETNSSNNVFGSLFANVLGPEPSRQSKTVSDNTILVSLLKLSSVLVQTALPPRRNVDEPMSTSDIIENDTESQTDEIKAEQQQNNENRVKVPCVADTVLQHSPTMKRLLGSLSHCCSSSFAMFVASSMYTVNSGESSNTLNEPQTVADAVFQLLMLLNKKATQPQLVVKPLYDFLNSTVSSLRFALPKLQLSEPFLWYILKVLDTSATVEIFTEMNGISVLCESMVRSNRTILNMRPNLVSMIMQYMTKSPKNQMSVASTSNGLGMSSGSKKSSSSMGNGGEDLINFAPFCTITSANATAQPADVLIQAPITSHRRARSPAWTYLFYPNESHVDLTVTLPSAVLLREIHLQPHLITLATCPSAVAIEITRDVNLGPVPVCQPMSTVGMTVIKMKFAQPEIATSVVIRLYRPRDSSNIGLTQISVLGTTTFADSSCYKNSSTVGEFLNDDEFIAKSSLGWLRILAQCFSVSAYNSNDNLLNSVITTAARTNGFLEACCSLLNVVGTNSSIALQNLETVLLKLGLHSKELGLKLIDNLLKNSIPQTFKLCNESVSDLLYDLCTTDDSFTRDRIITMLDWVKGLYAARVNAIRDCHYATNPYNGFIKCLAAILWSAYSTNLINDLPNLITKELFESVFQWTLILDNDEPLKNAMDSMLCSICCIRPELFPLLLEKIGVLIPNLSTDAGASISDDQKDPDRMTTDDRDESDTTAEWYSHLIIEELSRLSLTSSNLRMIAMACQSPLAIQQLLDSGLPRLLISAILELCYRLSREQNPVSDQCDENLNRSENPSTCLTDSDKAEEHVHANVHCPIVSVGMVAEILDFFSEICSEGHMRDWLGSYEGSVFWKPLLDILCNNNPLSNSARDSNFNRLEESMIKFLSRVSSCHPKNQEALTVNLISVIRKPGTSVGTFKTTITGFTRRLVLQLLLESEKILVSIRSEFPLQRKDQSFGYISHHPSKRPNAHHLLFYLRTHTKCQEILDNCVSSFNNILPTLPMDASLQPDITTTTMNQGTQNSSKHLFGMGSSSVGLGMEFLSVAAGVTAKDKRYKEVKNQAAAAIDLISKFRVKLDESLSINSMSDCSQLALPACPHAILSPDTTLSQILSTLQQLGHSLSTPCITLNLVQGSKLSSEDLSDTGQMKVGDFEPLASPLQIFSSRGGLSLLAHYLPTVYPENSKSSNNSSEREKSPPSGEWVKVEPNDDVYEDVDDTLTESPGKILSISSVPQHSLAAFGLFLRLPAYSEVLLRDKIKAQCLLRLVLGVTGDGEGNEIYSLSLASSLPTLPFEVFRQLLDCSPLTTDDGVLLRRMVIEVGAIHLVLNCLGIFTHQSQTYQFNAPQTEVAASAPPKTSNGTDDQLISDDKSHVYWAKGTGFGTGSTQQSWNVEQALLRQKSEEEHVTILLEVLSSYINPGDRIPSGMNTDDMIYRETNDDAVELPPIFLFLLQQSCLLPALSSYLRNDSVLDITRHVPLYRAILKLLRAIALSRELITLLMTDKKEASSSNSIASLLLNMKSCVDTYASRLKFNKKSNLKGQTQKVTVTLDDGDDEGLALLIPDIQETTMIVQNATFNEQANHTDDEDDKMSIEHPIEHSVEQRYLEVMKKMQFGTFEMITETDNGYRFVVAHHFENNVRMAGDRGHPARVKRLAQETVTLSTSLPLSYSSSVFVRCDNDRLDIMKVLITGPADTPYANGCFEFDVYFPPDYPTSPMMISLETTGRHTVRFNPNLYNDGKVCLSVLNTWHGRPEEKWNAQTSSFLQVLVSIQSLILVPEPYFNEPGFERSRGTPSGTHSSREYNSNIYQACVRWAMLEQIKNPSPCFKDVIHTHFWMKRHEICTQIENWITELSKPQYSERSGRTISFNSMVLRRQYKQLREELAKLPCPPDLEDFDGGPFNPAITQPSSNPIFPLDNNASVNNDSLVPYSDSDSSSTGMMQVDPNNEVIEIL